MVAARIPLGSMFTAPPRGGAQATPVAFNPRSEELLSGVNPALAMLLRKVEAQMPDAFEISEGMRSQDRQADMVAQGKSQTMNSKHLTGNATDIVLQNPDGSANWDFESYRPVADAAKATAAEMGISDFVWGGDWKTLKDGVHFQVGPSSGATPAGAGGAGLSFGSAVGDAEPPRNIMDIASMFDPRMAQGLSMGSPLAGIPQQAERRAETKVRKETADQERKKALADLIRY